MDHLGASLNNQIAGNSRFFAGNIVAPESGHEGAVTSPGDAGGKIEKDTTLTADHATIGANLTDHLGNSPLLEKLSGLVAGALVASGLQKVKTGIKERDRDKVLEGSKTAVWGFYQGLNAADKIFTCLFPFTQSVRLLGGFINADIAATGMYKDNKNKKATTERTLHHSSALTWGLRHATLGFKGLQDVAQVSGLIDKCNPFIKGVITSAPIIGAVSVGFGLAGGTLDAVLGVRNLSSGIKTNNKEKKILGALDIGVGIAAGTACLLSGIPGMVVMGTGSALMAYKTWRTDKETIKKIAGDVRDFAKNTGQKIKKAVTGIFTGSDETKDAEGNRKIETLIPAENAHVSPSPDSPSPDSASSFPHKMESPE